MEPLNYEVRRNETAPVCKQYDPTDPSNTNKDLPVQLVLSLTLGVSAFVGFCLLRPRWKTLYSARKKQIDAAVSLPELPDSFFGWMPVLYKVTEEEVLASAGLDAYVYLSFFKMSMKLIGTMFLLATVILYPINKTFANFGPPKSRPKSENYVQESVRSLKGKLPDTSYLWAYLVFTYIFTGLTIYFIRGQTLRIIKVRQEYLGNQETVTDRTIKLSGIPSELRSEEILTETIEKLNIGKVESVTICRDWKLLDDLMDKRKQTLRRLEESWAVHLGQKGSVHVAPTSDPEPENEDENGNRSGNGHESGSLLGNNHATTYDLARPTTRIRYGFLKLNFKKVDAIDYYTEKLRKLDESIIAARKKEYKATALAFVTMESFQKCQALVQMVIDGKAGQLLAKQAPAPSDVIWRNTYLPRSRRMLQSWSVTVFILALSVFWLIPVLLLAGLFDLCTISKVLPKLAALLEAHDIIKALVQTGLPTLVVSLLNIAVPFLYDYLANLQGTISQADVELSVISKNFLFTFFNLFLVLTIGGSASTFWPVLFDKSREPAQLSKTLAGSVKQLGTFYTNFIMLQGIGLLPFRLLEFGAVSLYPLQRVGSKTPRDFAELLQPPIFQYGFYLPSALLIFILCLVYSILPAGYKILFFGLIYFAFGYYTYKYQLLYAMEQPQHSTGGAWPMICYRIMLGLGVFQVVMAGLIALEEEIIASILVIPLIPFTVWYSYYYGRIYEPLMKFIALRSIVESSSTDFADEERPSGIVRRQSTTIDESREKGQRFINPSLVEKLENMWVNGDPDSSIPEEPSPVLDREESTSSEVSLGDTHIWRESNSSEN